MNPSRRSFTPAQASAALGVSAKALRLYEQHGLLNPDRTRTGWRAYDAGVMARAAEIVALRSLGLSLAQVARVLEGGPRDLDIGLGVHEARLSEQGQRTAQALERVRSLRADLAQGRAPAPAAVRQAIAQTAPLTVRFAQRFAAALPDAMFLGLDRVSDPAVAQRLADDPVLAEQVERRLTWLVEDGAERSAALTALVVAMQAATPAVLVIDMVEEGLNAATQTALMAHLRLRGTSKRALILMTRSSLVLDLDALGRTEVVIHCPANHSVPLRVVPYPGGQGYEAVATCVAPPEVRARTAGIVAVRPMSGGQPAFATTGASRPGPASVISV